MKKLYYLFLLYFYPLFVHGQTSPQRILGTFIYNNIVYNYEFAQNNPDNYALGISSLNEANQEETNTEKLKQNNAETNESSQLKYRFSEFSNEIFVGVFLKQMENKFKLDISNNTLKDKAAEVFFSIKTRLYFIDDEPITAYMILRKDVIYSFLRGNSSVYYDKDLSKLYAQHNIKRVDIETEDGAIKNISVKLVKPIQEGSTRSYIEFKNQFPISISGKFDPERFANTNLYCFDCAGIQGLTRYIKLSNLVLLDIVLENNKEDYSPSNSIISLTPDKPIAELRKEKRSKILEIAAFSDFVGLDQEQPNGLIQIEAKRKININTNYHLFSKIKDSENLASKYNFSDIISFEREKMKKGRNGRFVNYIVHLKDKGKTITETISVLNRRFKPVHYNFLGSIEPKLLFSKLEENNRFLDSIDVEEQNNTTDIDTIRGEINPIKLYQYQIASFGATANLFKVSFPQYKLNWSVLNVGLYWFRTRVQNNNLPADNVSIPLNNRYWVFGSQFVFSPDARWGVSIGSDYLILKSFNSTYDITKNKGLLQTKFDAFLKTSDNARLFFRFRWTHELRNRSNTFTQIQLGYALNLFTKGNTEQSNK